MVPTHCPDCRKTLELKRVQDWALANPEKVSAAKRRYKASNPRVWNADARRVAWIGNLRRRYNMTLDDYEQMLIAQNGVCAICEGPPRGRGADEDRFHVDHCHETGRVRGLLCSPCNTAVGLLDEDAKRALRLAQYIEDANEAPH